MTAHIRVGQGIRESSQVFVVVQGTGPWRAIWFHNEGRPVAGYENVPITPHNHVSPRIPRINGELRRHVGQGLHQPGLVQMHSCTVHGHAMFSEDFQCFFKRHHYSYFAQQTHDLDVDQIQIRVGQELRF